jgi:ParB family chromosome partitioning protein
VDAFAAEGGQKMSTGLVHSLLDAQPSTPAGEPPLKVVMIDRKNIIVNPDNHKIYVIGDVSRLKEDIKTNGVRQSLEVVDLKDGNYKLIGGERRLTACEELAREGDTRFNALPCVILKLKNDDDDKIALITANATARELTDGERLAQYEALKEILTRRKKNGQLEGKVRDELCRILGLSAGAAARLNAIVENCDQYTREKLSEGIVGLTYAYGEAHREIQNRRIREEEKRQIKEREKEQHKIQNAPQKVYEKPVVFDCPPKAVETVPQNSDYDEWNLPSECRVAVEKAHREAAQKQEEQQRGKKTLHMLTEKTIKETAPWELAWEDVQFGLEYYKQPLPGGAMFWKRIDQNRQHAGIMNYDDYAIILQDGKFFTCGWIPKISVIAELVRYFVLK